MMQYDLQARVLGSGFWQCAAAQRKELETITAGNGSDNDLIGALQQMHALEEEYAMHAAGSENFEENGLSFFTHHADDDNKPKYAIQSKHSKQFKQFKYA